MSTKKFLTAVSVIALMGAAPALADNTMNDNVNAKPGSEAAAEQSTGSLERDAENAWKDIKHDTKEAYKNVKEGTKEAYSDVKEGTKEAYRDIKATYVSENETNGNYPTVTIDERMTSEGMIGQPVYNQQGQSVATIKDIILDSDGEAVMVVVADGEFIGLGKTAAFDYGSIARVNADGDIIMPLTEEMIDNAAEFSYDRRGNSNNVRVIPSNGYSVSELLDGQLIDENKKTIAQIDNISFRNGQADQIIVGFNKILGMGGEKAALDFGSTDLVRDRNDNGYDFQLNDRETAQFESYKQTVTN
jgi:sporulation protein YlmC with PRC-barrel domain